MRLRSRIREHLLTAASSPSRSMPCVHHLAIQALAKDPHAHVTAGAARACTARMGSTASGWSPPHAAVRTAACRHRLAASCLLHGAAGSLLGSSCLRHAQRSAASATPYTGQLSATAPVHSDLHEPKRRPRRRYRERAGPALAWPQYECTAYRTEGRGLVTRPAIWSMSRWPLAVRRRPFSGCFSTRPTSSSCFRMWRIRPAAVQSRGGAWVRRARKRGVYMEHALNPGRCMDRMQAAAWRCSRAGWWLPAAAWSSRERLVLVRPVAAPACYLA